jgi:hypothetical protein
MLKKKSSFCWHMYPALFIVKQILNIENCGIIITWQPGQVSGTRGRKAFDYDADIRHMNLRKTLAFCYLGCLFSASPITVADILRQVSLLMQGSTSRKI